MGWTTPPSYQRIEKKKTKEEKEKRTIGAQKLSHMQWRGKKRVGQDRREGGHSNERKLDVIFGRAAWVAR